jgi:histidinol dehydrogenase
MTSFLRFTGAAKSLSEADRQLLFDRRVTADPAVKQATASILERVREKGDAALRELAFDLDGVTLASVEVPRVLWKQSWDELDPKLRRALERAAANIQRAHKAFLPKPVEVETEPGVTVGRRPDPLQRVGIYAPGGRAAYPSSVLMGAVPARIAGVKEIILCSPPAPTGNPHPLVLAAAELAQVDRVFALGGAGAVAAMAYGTQSVPRVDRIVGPGNAYVAEAKVQVSGEVGIDLPAGPSEILIIADASANPAVLCREMLAQAEHDPHACVVALVLDGKVSRALELALAESAPASRRSEVIRESLSSRGAVLTVGSLDEAVSLCNAFAPEHLLLALASPDEVLSQVRGAGTVFLGETSSVAFGDYLTGANHVLPTGGSGRTWSGLSVQDFLRWTTYQRVKPKAAAKLSEDCQTFAEAEGLFAHGEAAAQWRKA